MQLVGVWQSSLISLKMTLSSRVSTWMDKLLSLMTTYKFAPEKSRQGQLHWQGKLKLVLYILQDDYLSLSGSVAIPWLVNKKLPNRVNQPRLALSRYLWKYGTSLKFFKIRHSRRPLVVVWSRWLKQPKSLKMSGLHPSFQKCTGRSVDGSRV